MRVKKRKVVQPRQRRVVGDLRADVFSPVAKARPAVTTQRFHAAVWRRRLGRSAKQLRWLIQHQWNNVTDPPGRLLLASQALEWPVVDEEIACAYLKVRLAAQASYFPKDLRKILKALLPPALEVIRGTTQLRTPRGAKPKLTPRQAEQVERAYRALLVFFQDPAHRPRPDQPEDVALLRTINREIDAFPPGRHVRLDEISFKLTEEAAPNRLAKMTVGIAFNISAGKVEKILVRSVHPPADRLTGR